MVAVANTRVCGAGVVSLVSCLLKATLLAATATIATGSDDPGLCVSHDGYPPFERAGKPPAKVSGLTFCME